MPPRIWPWGAMWWGEIIAKEGGGNRGNRLSSYHVPQTCDIKDSFPLGARAVGRTCLPFATGTPILLNGSRGCWLRRRLRGLRGSIVPQAVVISCKGAVHDYR